MDMEIDRNLDPQLAALSAAQTRDVATTVMKSNLRLFPPPIFSRQTIPQGYKFVVSTFIQ